MLGKLIKYDLKYGYKIILIIHLVFLVACIMGRFMLNQIDYDAPPEALGAALGISISLFSLVIAGISFSTWIIVAVRFYKNLFTDEGYLTWTLPATSTQLLWSKIISGAIFCAIDILASAIGIILLVTGKNVVEAYSHISADVTEALGMPLSMFGLCLLIIFFFSTIFSVIMIYFCIVIGQLFPGHRVLGAIIVYFVVSFVIQIITVVVMLVLNLYPSVDLLPEGQTAAHYFFAIISMSVGIATVTAIPQYIVTHYIMKKKINLL